MQKDKIRNALKCVTIVALVAGAGAFAGGCKSSCSSCKSKTGQQAKSSCGTNKVSSCSAHKGSSCSAKQ